MSLAIDLDEVGANFPEEGVDHLRGQGPAGIGDVFGRVKIEVDAEEAISSSEFRSWLGKGCQADEQERQGQAM